MTALGYQLFDADTHYYEAEDAFIRHGDESVKRFVRWVQEGKRRHLVFGNTISAVPPNPTFNPISQPGAFHTRLKELESANRADEVNWNEADSVKNLYKLEPLQPSYRDRDERLKVLDEQDVEGCFMFPTLGDCVEGMFLDNPVMGHKAYHAYNLWVDEDWGFNYKDRIYAAPYIPMLDAELAADELEFALNRGAKVVTARPGPAAGRSPADPAFDRFWSLANEAGVLIAYHAFGGRTTYSDSFERTFGAQPVSDPAYYGMLEHALSADRGITDLCMALVLGNTFGRFPNVRIASIEMGINWVPWVLHALDHAGGIIDRKVEAFGTKVDGKPSEIFKRHVYVSPFPEEDVVGLTEMIGVDHVLFGSDFPHPEGTVKPIDYVDCLTKLHPDDTRKIMRENALSFVRS